MTRHLHGDGETWLTGAVGSPKPSPGPMRWPIDTTAGPRIAVEHVTTLKNSVQVVRDSEGNLWMAERGGMTLVPYESGE